MELHTASDVKVIKSLLIEDKVDVNFRNDIGEAPIHTLVRNAIRKKKCFDILWNFLLYCNNDDFDIDIKSDTGGDTALHIAAEKNDLDIVKALVVFDADVNSLNILKMSPMDHAFLHKNEEMMEFLQTRGGVDGTTLRRKLSRGKDTVDAGSMPVRCKGNGLPPLNTSPCKSPYKSLGETPLELSVHNGQRILCLDGGGLKGLIMIEVLIYIEKLTGKKIVDLFDWIVGTSTGGIIALALVYAKKSLQELKQLFFRLKDEVFGTAKMAGGYGCDTSKLAAILKTYFGDMKLSEIDSPRVFVTAIDCKKTDLKLVFFNNCFYDEDEKYRDVYVWKAARYTSAAPVYFEPDDGYIDGGIKANNPTDFALTKIQKYCDANDSVLKAARKDKLTKYACVVSVGCGVFKPEDLGEFSIQKQFSLGGFQPLRIVSVLKNLLKMLGNALSNEEEIAESCRLRCEKQGIPFYRFSPAFDIEDPVSETDVVKLCSLIIKAQSCLTTAWDVQIHRLANLLQRVEKGRTQAEGFF